MKKWTRTWLQTPPEVTPSADNLMCTNNFFPFLCSRPDTKSSLRWLLRVITFHANPGPDWCLSTSKTFTSRGNGHVVSEQILQAVCCVHSTFPHHYPCPLHSVVCSHYKCPPHQHWNCIKGRMNLYFGCAGLVWKASRTLFLAKAAAQTMKSYA